jgi:hypothetical protein
MSTFVTLYEDKARLLHNFEHGLELQHPFFVMCKEQSTILPVYTKSPQAGKHILFRCLVFQLSSALLYLKRHINLRDNLSSILPNDRKIRSHFVLSIILYRRHQD